MFFSNYNQALVRALLAGVVATGAACSRSDRANTGSDSVQTGAAVTPSDTANAADTGSATPQSTATTSSSMDTSVAAPKHQTTSPSASTRDNAAGQRNVSGYRAMAHDTSAPSPSVVAGDSTQAGKPGQRIESTEASQQTSNDTASAADSTRIRPPEDSTELHGNVTSDSTPNVAAEAGVTPAAGDTAQPMARDTSTVLAQADTATRETQPADTSAQVTQSDSSQMSSDTASLSVAVDTTSETPDTMAQASADSSTLSAQADTSTQVGDTTAQAADTSAQMAVGATVDTTAPIRPTEDSTKVLAKSDTLPSDRDRIRPPEDSTELHGQVNANEEKVKADQAPAAAAPVEATRSMATGADAVALMTRQGDRCKVKDPETSHEVQWDFAASPATLNPCGTGTMTLPRIQTEEK